MSLDAYLESLPFREIIKHPGGEPANAVAFTGIPRKHPYDPEKFMLFVDPLGEDPSILEFKLGDVVKVEQLPSPVTKEGESLLLVRAWARRGALGMQYQPFEVNDPPLYIKDSPKLRDKLSEGLFRTGE